MKKKKLKVTQIASGSGKNKIFKQNLVGLGLGKMHKSVILEDTDSIRGMATKVSHLVRLEEVE